MARLGISAGQAVLVNANTRLITGLDDKLPDDCVRIAAAHASTAALGPMFGTLALEKVSAERAA
jgi:NADH-quinone oxidoreductase subunit G